LSNPFTAHHEFLDIKPQEPDALVDALEQQRQENRNVICRTFESLDGVAALPLLRRLAGATPEPINVADADKATQMLWWRSARLALIDEIEAIIAKEKSK